MFFRQLKSNFASLKSRRTAAGFTLIELLVVIAIISLLSSVVLASLSGAREEARISAAQAEMNSLRSGIELLINDTGKWPNGCRPGSINNPEVFLNEEDAGLVNPPAVGVTGGTGGIDCEWTARDVAEWNGPYVTTDELIDPWGYPYLFDPDYSPYSGCSSEPGQSTISVIVAEGPTINAAHPDSDSAYDCDDVWINLR